MDTGSRWLDVAAITLALVLAVSLGAERVARVPGCPLAAPPQAAPSLPASQQDGALHDMLTHD